MINNRWSRLVLGAAATSLAAGVLVACSPSTPTTDPGAETPGGECTPLHEFPTLVPGTLTVAAMNAYPKFLADSPDGPYKGIDYVLIEAFAAENCLTVDYNPGTPPAVTLELQEGRADMIGGLVLSSPARAEVFGLGDRFLYETLSINSKAGYKTVGELVGKKVGVLSGSSYQALMEAVVGVENVVQYQTDVNIYEDVDAGRIDAGALPSLHGVYLSTQFPDVISEIVAADPAYADATTLFDNVWPFTKGNDAMLAAVNDFAARAHTSGLLEEALASVGIPEDKWDFYLNGR